ncbi:MAG TPA: NAD-dependent epimerase/dehydratase family protein [Chloroflexota bacterium]|nr:NAD-dependent epimerase/dehydratase family protein [Chloroflexota bacterium]
MRYFVTGATGFVGGHLARQLLADGHQVSALVRDPDRAGALAAAGVELHRGDVTEPASIRGAMAGADGVFHVAAWYRIGARDRSPAERINVDGTRHVLETMRELGVPKGVYTSTLAVFSDTGGRVVDESYSYDGPHLSEYDRTKWLAHYRVALPMMRSGLPLVIVQPGVVYGPGDHSATGQALRDYLRRRLPLVPLGSAYCWAHVDDVARGHVLAMEKGRPGESYILAGPCHSFVEALEIAERVTGVPPPRLRAPPWLLRLAAWLMTPLAALMPLPESYHPESLRAAAGVTYLGSNRKAREELGYDPRPLEQGFREVLLPELARLRRRSPP